MPLGVRDGLEIPAGAVVLDAGDILLLYTDGVTDSTGFGRDEQKVRLFFESQQWPTAATAAGAVISEAKRGGRAQPDDMSAVVVRIPTI
jgi:serine phosphatase RsbU (regulator of sigma subunit)